MLPDSYLCYLPVRYGYPFPPLVAHTRLLLRSCYPLLPLRLQLRFDLYVLFRARVGYALRLPGLLTVTAVSPHVVQFTCRCGLWRYCLRLLLLVLPVPHTPFQLITFSCRVYVLCRWFFIVVSSFPVTLYGSAFILYGLVTVITTRWLPRAAFIAARVSAFVGLYRVGWFVCSALRSRAFLHYRVVPTLPPPVPLYVPFGLQRSYYTLPFGSSSAVTLLLLTFVAGSLPRLLRYVLPRTRALPRSVRCLTFTAPLRCPFTYVTTVGSRVCLAPHVWLFLLLLLFYTPLRCIYVCCYVRCVVILVTRYVIVYAPCVHGLFAFVLTFIPLPLPWFSWLLIFVCYTHVVVAFTRLFCYRTPTTFAVGLVLRCTRYGCSPFTFTGFVDWLTLIRCYVVYYRASCSSHILMICLVTLLLIDSILLDTRSWLLITLPTFVRWFPHTFPSGSYYSYVYCGYVTLIAVRFFCTDYVTTLIDSPIVTCARGSISPYPLPLRLRVVAFAFAFMRCTAFVCYVCYFYYVTLLCYVVAGLPDYVPSSGCLLPDSLPAFPVITRLITFGYCMYTVGSAFTFV